MTLRSAIDRLRDPRVFPVLKNALGSASCSGFRIVHFSVQPNHVHLLVEAHDTDALCGGMRRLAIRTALRVNRALGRRGPVWKDRFHLHELEAPREVRNCLNYVLQNWKKHVEGARGLDPCSSGQWFDGWRHLDEGTLPGLPSPVSAPRTWLASTGWRRHGLLSTDESPSRAPRAPRASLLPRHPP